MAPLKAKAFTASAASAIARSAKASTQQAATPQLLTAEPKVKTLVSAIPKCSSLQCTFGCYACIFTV